jgi:hypothetical protein
MVGSGEAPGMVNEALMAVRRHYVECPSNVALDRGKRSASSVPEFKEIEFMESECEGNIGYSQPDCTPKEPSGNPLNENTGVTPIVMKIL